jgi:hypothetical protein
VPPDAKDRADVAQRSIARVRVLSGVLVVDRGAIILAL